MWKINTAPCRRTRNAVVHGTIFIALGFFAGISAAGETGTDTAKLEPFPAVSLPPLYADGVGFNSEIFAEQDITLVNFFASWCLPCRIEHPHLVELAQRGVTVIGIDYMDEAQAAIEYLQSVGDPYWRIGVDPGTTFDASLQVNDIPQTFVVNRQGKILFRYVGRLQPPVLEQTIIPLILAGAPAGGKATALTPGSSTMSGMLIALTILVASALFGIVVFRRETTEQTSKLKAASVAGVVLPTIYIAVILTGGQTGTPPANMEETYAVLSDFLEKEEARPAAPPRGDMSMEGVTTRLFQRLQNNPGDIAGWTLLARSYASMGQTDKAIEAYEVAINHDPNNMDLIIGYGEMLVGAARGEVTGDARSAFAEVARRQSGHPAAEYYLGLSDLQAGDAQAAHDRWLRLAETGAETNAPWLVAVQPQLDQAAASLGIVAKQFVAIAEAAPSEPQAAPPEPAADASADAAEIAAPDTEFIRAMVARLAARLESEPNDLDGWLQLGRSYGVLGEWKEAAGAYDHAAALAPENPEIAALRDDARARAGT